VGGLWRATADLVRGRAFITMLYRSSQVSKDTVVGLCTVFGGWKSNDFFCELEELANFFDLK